MIKLETRVHDAGGAVEGVAFIDPGQVAAVVTATRGGGSAVFLKGADHPVMVVQGPEIVMEEITAAMTGGRWPEVEPPPPTP